MKRPSPLDILEASEVEILQQLKDSPELLEAIPAWTGQEPRLQEHLREKYSPELVRSAFRLLDVRRKAEGILPNAEQLWLTNVGLEQSTALDVARHKAKRFPADVEVYDLCSGVGVDTDVLLKRGPVVSVDINPAMVIRNKWNSAVWNGQQSANLAVKVADVKSLDLSGRIVHLDPDRRDGHDRPTKRLEQYQPDLGWMQQLVKTAAGGAIKLSPASNFMQKFPGCEIELVSLNGECKEATVWFGELAGDRSFRATVLPAGESVTGDPLDAYCPLAEAPMQYLFDPNPAVVRSGLLDQIGEMHSLQRLDKADEYLTADEIPQTDLVTAFRVEATLGNNPKELKKHLRNSPGSSYEIKCRHLKVDANELQRKLPKGDGPVKTVFFLRVNGKARVVVSERIRNVQISS